MDFQKYEDKEDGGVTELSISSQKPKRTTGVGKYFDMDEAEIEERERTTAGLEGFDDAPVKITQADLDASLSDVPTVGDRSEAVEYLMNKSVEERKALKEANAPSFVESAIGVADAGLTSATAMTGGLIGTAAGAVHGIAEQVVEGDFSQAAGERTRQKALEYANALTRAPATETGAAILEEVGDLAEPLQAVGPMAQLSAVGSMSRAATGAALAKVKPKSKADTDIPEPKPEQPETVTVPVDRVPDSNKPDSSPTVKTESPSIDPNLLRRAMDGDEDARVELRAKLDEQPKPTEYMKPDPLPTTKARAEPVKPKEVKPVKKPDIDPEIESASIGALVNKAAQGNKAAKKKLIEKMDVDPKAKKEAESLGFDLPADVFSRNTQVKQAAGLSRSKAAGTESHEFTDKVIAAKNRADELFKEIDGTPDIATLNNKVKTALNGSITAIKVQEKKLYKKVDKKVPKDRMTTLHNLRKEMDSIVSEVGKKGLSKAEKKLIAMVKGGNVTYGRLIREKQQIGSALGSVMSKSPYASVDSTSLGRIYAAIKQDHVSSVGEVSKKLRAQLEQANAFTVERKAIEKKVISGFGKDGNNSIAQTLQSAITTGGKGSDKALNKILDVVPKKLRKEALSTAMSALSQTQRANQEGFSFSRFNKMYRGLAANKPVMAAINKELGADASAMLKSLSNVSQKVNEAQSNVLTTGKANQVLNDSMVAEGIVSKILSSTVGRVTATTAAVAAGGGNPVVGAVGANAVQGLSSAIAKGSPARLKAASRLFDSDEMSDFISGKKTPKQVAESREFKKWVLAQDTGLKRAIMSNPEAWIIAGAQVGGGSDRTF